MSLDVYLKSSKRERMTCAHCESKYWSRETLFEANITHNLNTMAGEAGIYGCLWRPDESGISKAGQLIDVLEEGLIELKRNPDHYRTFEPKNKYGTYDGFIPWIQDYLDACKKWPDSVIEVSR